MSGVDRGLQFAENLTDRQADHAVRGRIDWKYLLSLELDVQGRWLAAYFERLARQSEA